MKKTILILIVLLSVFFTEWGIKVRSAINPPQSEAAEAETPWYESRYSTPQASDDWTLDPEIPDNYVPVPGEDEMYMVIDDSGTIINYRQRNRQADGSWEWKDIEDPDLTLEIEAVEGSEDLYKITDDEDVISYQKYIRNADNTYAFVETDKDGKALDDGSAADEIPDNYVHYSDDIYALYNENNVLIGYRERLKEEDGSYCWKEIAAPDSTSSDITSLSDRLSAGSSEDTDNGSGSGDNSQKENNSDGTYTVTKSSTNTVTENGYSVVYKTTVYYTYSSDGTLLSTKKEGPEEVSRTAVGSGTLTPNKSLIASTLDGELARVSADLSFNTDKANEVLSLLNAERVSQGQPALSMSTSSDSYKLACIKAADMALYGYCATESPMYGTLEDLLSRFGCSSDNPSENIWKAGNKTAEEIHSRFQSNEDSRTIRMSDYDEVGLAIVDKDGNTYVAEIFLH